METIIVKQGQNIFDIALQATGDASTALDLALANGLCLTEDLTVGQTILINEGLTGNKNILELYRRNNIYPATAITADHIANAPFEGIGFWGIEYDFIVS